MSVRFDNSSDRLLRTSSLLDYNSDYTIMLLLYLNSTTSSHTAIFDLNDDSNEFKEGLRLSSDGQTVQIIGANGEPFSGPEGLTLSIGTWNHLALVRSGTNLSDYTNGEINGSITADQTGRPSNTRMEFGGQLTANVNRLDGRVSAIKVWSAALTQAQIKSEMWQITPNRFANIYGWYPCFPGSVERLRDYSLNARTFTESGTLTDEAGPPVRWGFETSPKTLLVASAVAGRLKYQFPLDGLGTFFRGMNG